jgi:hypothetical protein
MKKLLIHQYTNHFSKKFRYYNIFWDNLIEELSKIHDIVEDRYRKNAHMGFNPISFELDELSEIENPQILECEMIIENLTDKEVYILSVSDDLTPAILNFNKSNLVKKIFVSQFIREKIYHHIPKESREKYFPWIYFPSNDFNLENYFYERKLKSSFIDKMYFRGSTSYRSIINHLDSNVFFGGDAIGGFEKYADEIINYSMALSLAGRGEFCYRDIECMAMGIPLIRFEYLSEMNQPLIPNEHYISVERPDNLKSWVKLDREGNETHAKMLKDTFLKVYKEKDFLDYISNNARQYYEEFLSPKSSIELTIKLLNI